MKRSFFLLSVLCFLIIGCQKEPYLIINPRSLDFPSEGGSQTIFVKANYDWTASVSGSGLKVSPSSGSGDGTVTVTASQAPGGDDLTGTITFSSQGQSKDVSITQEGGNGIVWKNNWMNSGKYSVNHAGGECSISIQYKADLKIEIEPSAQSWIKDMNTKAMTDAVLRFNVLPNEGPRSRQGKVTISDASGKAAPVEVLFVQDCKTIIDIEGTIEVPGESSVLEIPFQGAADLLDIKSEDKWISYIGYSNTLNFEISNNLGLERRTTVTIKIYGEDEPVSFDVVQKECRFRQGLMKIYKAMDGPNWKYADGWGSEAPIDEWEGIQVRVKDGKASASIDFNQCGLKGEFPDCFEDLAGWLQSFRISELGAYLENNYVAPQWLKGSLPPSFAKCTRLESFILLYTSMTSLPEVFYDMPDLKYVDLQKNFWQARSRRVLAIKMA